MLSSLLSMYRFRWLALVAAIRIYHKDISLLHVNSQYDASDYQLKALRIYIYQIRYLTDYVKYSENVASDQLQVSAYSQEYISSIYFVRKLFLNYFNNIVRKLF